MPAEVVLVCHQPSFDKTPDFHLHLQASTLVFRPHSQVVTHFPPDLAPSNHPLRPYTRLQCKDILASRIPPLGFVVTTLSTEHFSELQRLVTVLDDAHPRTPSRRLLE